MDLIQRYKYCSKCIQSVIEEVEGFKHVSSDTITVSHVTMKLVAIFFFVIALLSCSVSTASVKNLKPR